MPLLPTESALERAVGEAIVLALGGTELPSPVVAGSVYFSPTDDPRAARPSVRCFWGAQVQLGRDTTHPVKQLQRWRFTLAQVAAADYTVEVLGAPYLYAAGPGDDAAAIVAGLLGELAADPDSASEAGEEGELFVEALVAGQHLDLKVSANLTREIVRDRAAWQTATSAERTLSLQVATMMSQTAPVAEQHALAYANLLRARLHHPDVQARLAEAGAAVRRIAAGPIAGQDTLVDNATETRASLEVVLSITVGAQHSSGVMESATTTTTISMEHPP